MKKQILEEPVNKVHFYVARDKDGVLGLYIGKPFRADHEFEADLLRGVVWLTSHVNYFGLNNEDYDYPHHINGVVEYDTPLVNAMIARLNAGEQSDQADADRDWLVDWFWETFGSWGLKYNFDSWIADLLYEFENEEVTV